jgi:serine/threonine-protein kinase
MGIDRYLGYDVSAQQPIMLTCSARTDEAGLQRFQRNLPIVRRLAHPHIAPLRGAGVHEGTPFVALEHLPSSRQYHRFPLPLSTAIRYASQLAEALAYAQSQGIYPGYCAPETIVIGQRGEALLTGFCLRLLEISQRPGDLDQRREFPVPLGYLPPEQVSGGRTGPGSDQYALAAVLYEWLSGVPLFQGVEPLTIVLQIFQAPPLTWQEQALALPPAVVQVIARALARKPEERFATLQAFSQALREASQQSG